MIKIQTWIALILISVSVDAAEIGGVPVLSQNDANFNQNGNFQSQQVSATNITSDVINIGTLTLTNAITDLTGSNSFKLTTGAILPAILVTNLSTTSFAYISTNGSYHGSNGVTHGYFNLTNGGAFFSSNVTVGGTLVLSNAIPDLVLTNSLRILVGSKEWRMTPPTLLTNVNLIPEVAPLNGLILDTVSNGTNVTRSHVTFATGSPYSIVGTNLVFSDALSLAMSDETTAITTSQVTTYRFPFACSLAAIQSQLNTASSSGLPTVDVKRNGTSLFTTLLTIDANEKTSLTAATPSVLTSTPLAIAADDELVATCTVAGTGAKGLKITFQFTRP